MFIGANTLYLRRADGRMEPSNVATTCAALDRLARVGYRAVEYSHCSDWTPEEARQIGAHARGLGLFNSSCHANFSRVDGTDPHAAGEVYLHDVQVCGATGANALVVHTPLRWGLVPPADARLADCLTHDLAALRPVAERAGELGVRLSLENGHNLDQMTYVLRLVEALDSKYVGVCVDTGHAALGDLGPARAVRLAGKLLVSTHLQDNYGEVDDHVPPGSGKIDWAELFVALREVDYQGVLMLELTDNAPHRPYDQDAEQRLGLQNVTQYAREAWGEG